MSLAAAAGLALLAPWAIGAYLVARGLWLATPKLGRGVRALVSVIWPVMICRPHNLLDVVMGRFHVEEWKRAFRA